MLDKIRSMINMFFFKLLGSNYRIKTLRKRGVKIGKNCLIYNISWSTEPYLIEIGDHVVVAKGTNFMTHDGGVWIFREKEPKFDLFGKIKVGNNCVIALNCIILPNTTIGNNCVIGAGSVVRGVIPDNSVAIGNPAKVVMSTGIYHAMIKNNPGRMDTAGISDHKKRSLILEKFSTTIK